MSVHRRIPDVAERGAEGRSLTHSGPCRRHGRLVFPFIERTTGHGGIIPSGILQFVDLMHSGPRA